jgi:shikimate kinase
MKIYIIGYMGSGKSTLGKKLSRAINYSFIDLDNLIEECAHYSIETIFKRFDETVFRKLEKEALYSTLSMSNTVISTGGGTVSYDRNMEWIKKNGLSIYLKLSPKSLQTRLLASKKKRPLIKSKKEDELLQFIENHLAEREIYYTQADIVVKGENLNIPILRAVIKAKLRNKGYSYETFKRF